MAMRVRPSTAMPRKVRARWYDGGNNWGDVLNPELIRALSGREVCREPWHPEAPRWRRTRPGRMLYHLFAPVRHAIDAVRPPVHLVVGSTLQHADDRTQVWGAGFIRENAHVREKPRSIFAVRGPLSRRILHAGGIGCPDIYGDPALLYPLMYTPERHPPDYAIGIIPHLCDQHYPMLDAWAESPEVKIINMGGGVRQVAEDVCRCAHIISSSLHGIVVADAFGLPSGWMVLSDGVQGGGFKFRDYFASLNMEKQPLHVGSGISVRVLIEHVLRGSLQGRIDLRKLLYACPFGDPNTIADWAGRLDAIGGNYVKCDEC